MAASVIDDTALDMPATAGSAISAPLTVEVITDEAAFAREIARFAAGGTVPLYQQAGFLLPYFRKVDKPRGARLAAILIRDAAGEARMLLPLAVCRTGAVTTAEFIGGKHSNFNMPLLRPGAQRISAAGLKQALADAGRKAGIDLYLLLNQPQEWEGVANPMASIGGQPSPSHGYKFALHGELESLLRERLSKDTRRKLRQKETKLAGLGALAYRKATTDAEALDLLDVFLKLKAARFQEQGIEDPFAGEAVRAFLSTIACGGDGRRSVLEMHALTLDGRPIAIFGGIADARRFSGLVTAFDPETEIARCSPGEVLLTHLVGDCLARGLVTFDLGVGEARYKDQFCDQREALFDTIVPVTLMGRLAAGTKTAALTAKRWIKQAPGGRALIAGLRKLKAG